VDIHEKTPGVKMLPLEECHPMHMLALLGCRAYPGYGFTLLPTLCSTTASVVQISHVSAASGKQQN
jgi:hypothetical protein